MSPNDKFNQRYITGKLINTTDRSPTQITSGGFMLPKMKDLYVKNRQKMQRKGIVMQGMRKKFEETLRNQE